MIIKNRFLFLLLICFFSGFFVCTIINKPREVESTKTITSVVRDTIVVFKKDSVGFQSPVKHKIKVEKVFLNNDSEKKNNNTISTNKYTGDRFFDKIGAKLYYEIYADSLQGTSFKLTIKEKNFVTTEKTIVEKTLSPKSNFFIGGGCNYANNNIQSAELGIMYSYKQKWQLGVVVNQHLNYNLGTKDRTSLGVRLYMPL